MLIAMRKHPTVKHIVVDFGWKLKNATLLRNCLKGDSLQWEYWPERNNLNKYDDDFYLQNTPGYLKHLNE
jgi:hypothetical protein